MAFAFNFSDDDGDDDDDYNGNMKAGSHAKMKDSSTASASTSFPRSGVEDVTMAEDQNAMPIIRAKTEDVAALLSTLPSRIAYSTRVITSPRKRRQAVLPRRELFDVKMQLMAEDGDDEENKMDEDATTDVRPNLATSLKGQVFSGIGKAKSSSGRRASHDIAMGDSDIEQNVYEGGFKSWEGASDLTQLLLDREITGDIDSRSGLQSFNILELGCGTALPTLAIFQHALDSTSEEERPRSLHFILADYNASVLRLVTLPNLLLTWALHHSTSKLQRDTAAADSASSASSASSEPPSSTSPNSPAAEPAFRDKSNDEGDLPITPALLEIFMSDLARRGISITLISGSWAEKSHFTSLLPSPMHLVLAAETIYSPKSLKSFTDTLLNILQTAAVSQQAQDQNPNAVALVAAKRVYFGVGGGVEEFMDLVRGCSSSYWHKAIVREITGTRIIGCDRDVGIGQGGSGTNGVARWLGEVFLSSAST